MTNNAEDTSSSCSGKDARDVINKLEEDVISILEFMASNGLIANVSKTEFMILNDREQNKEATIKVGNSTVTQTQTAKRLGITIL